MARKLPPLNAIRAFEAAGRHGSFTRAAAELSVTHGAVSKQVALLEGALGTALFHRSGTQLALTEHGQAYLRECSAVLDRLHLATLQMTSPRHAASLSINAPPTFTMHWLLPRLSPFQRQWPELELRMTTSLEAVDFQRHGYDIAIRGAFSPMSGLRAVPFMTEIILPVCHADLIERGALRTPADLQRHTLLSYATEPYAWADWLATAGTPLLAPLSHLRFEQMYFALQAAAEGLGVVLVPLFLAIDQIIAGKLVTPFGALACRQRRYFAYSMSPTPAHEAFCDWLLKEGKDTERAIMIWAASAGWNVSELPAD